MSVRVWLLKSHIDDEGKRIPRGRYIYVGDDVALELEATDPKRAIRADRTAEIKAYGERVEGIIKADRAKRAAKKK